MDLGNLLPLLLSQGDPRWSSLLNGFFSGQAGQNPVPPNNPGPGRVGSAPAADAAAGGTFSPEAMLKLLGPLLNPPARESPPAAPVQAPPPAPEARGLRPLAGIADPTAVWCLNAYFGARR